MALVVVDDGALRSCRQLTQQWPSARFVGLFSNELTMDRHLTIESIEECAFSGYGGKQELGTFGDPEMQGDRAVAYSVELLWSHDGGPVSDWVVGYFVVDSDGALLWVEDRDGGPVAMTQGGQTYKVTPALSAGTRYGATT